MSLESSFFQHVASSASPTRGGLLFPYAGQQSETRPQCPTEGHTFSDAIILDTPGKSACTCFWMEVVVKWESRLDKRTFGVHLGRHHVQCYHSDRCGKIFCKRIKSMTHSKMENCGKAWAPLDSILSKVRQAQVHVLSDCVMRGLRKHNRRKSDVVSV